MCFQVTIRATRDDLEDFFSQAGKVAEVHLIRDTRTKKSKGLAYIEMDSVESGPKALALCGQLVLGLPCIVQASQSSSRSEILLSSLHMVFKRFGSPPCSKAILAVA